MTHRIAMSPLNPFIQLSVVQMTLESIVSVNLSESIESIAMFFVLMESMSPNALIPCRFHGEHLCEGPDSMQIPHQLYIRYLER